MWPFRKRQRPDPDPNLPDPQRERVRREAEEIRRRAERIAHELSERDARNDFGPLFKRVIGGGD